MNTKETQFQQSITQLRTRLLVMCASVGIALDEACAALADGNLGRAVAVVDGDGAINGLETEIDEMALTLLVRNQPVAQDLRFVVAALRMVSELERIGDEAASIAERTLILNAPLPEPVMKSVTPLMELAVSLYKKATEAFRDGEPEKAWQLCRSEDESTQMEVRALQGVMDYFCLNNNDGRSGQAYVGMHGILICRALNRVCHRAANIAEQTYFIVRGENIKHAPGPQACRS